MPPTVPRPTKPRNKSWSRPLSDLVSGAIGPVAARHGFSEADLILHWRDIVGARAAAATRPIKLQWPPRAGSHSPDASAKVATLHVRVESGFALDLQHMADQIVERINGHLGWRCVGRILLKQGPIDELERPPPRRRAPDARAIATARQATEKVVDHGLRDALARLGAHVLR